MSIDIIPTLPRAPLPTTVELAAPSSAPAWDQYVAAHPRGTVFHGWRWRTAIEHAYELTPVYLAALRGGQIVGVLPLFLVRSSFFGRVLASGMFASQAGICSDDNDAAQALLTAAIATTREARADYFELKSCHPTDSPALQRHTDYVNYTLPVGDLDVLWQKTLQTRARTAVRKARSFGLTLACGHDQLEPFYDLIARNMRRLGTPVHSRRLYESILAALGGDADVMVARHGQRPVSALLFLRDQATVSILAAASEPSALQMNPNNFVYWETLRHANEIGAARVDFGRSLANSGPAKFKESWGATPDTLYYEYFLNRTQRIPHLHQGNRRYQLAVAVWKRLPIRLTTLLGPHIIKSIP